MKKSNYTYIINRDSESYWYNGISRMGFKVSRSLSFKLEELIKNSEHLKQANEMLYGFMASNGFLIPDETDELEIIRNKYNADVEKKDYFLVILPTLNCNFKCNYCVQSHIPSSMNEMTKDAICRHLRYMVEEEKISTLVIEWFGGEPFLYFKTVIEPVSQYAKSLCEKNGIPYNTCATTNGSLINPEVASRLSSLSFARFQITIDGEKDLHDTVKYSNAFPSAFDKTLFNIVNIIKNNPKILIVLRINYTSATLNSAIVEDVSKRIPQEYRKNIKILLKKVWQEEVDPSRFVQYLKVLTKFHALGFNVEWLDITPDFMPCYVNKKYYTCINYNGQVLKCTNCEDLYNHEHPRGIISDDGAIVWRDDFDKINQQASFENKDCLSCKKLPICLGVCPKSHIMNEHYCKWEAIDIDLEEAIVAYIDHL